VPQVGALVQGQGRLRARVLSACCPAAAHGGLLRWRCSAWLLCSWLWMHTSQAVAPALATSHTAPR
jgi:hypothetical protein